MIGVIGGMGPLATLDFMHKVIEESGAADDADHVPMLVSCDPRIPPRPAAILAEGTSPLPALLQVRDRLLAGGATVLVMPCVTAHHWYEALAGGCAVPFPSLVDAGCDAAGRIMPRGARVGIAATRATLAAGLFDAALARRGLQAVNPSDDVLERALLPCIAAVKSGQIARAAELLDATLQALADQGATHFLLACTELPIAAANRKDALTAACIDPTRALARCAVAWWRTHGAAGA